MLRYIQNLRTFSSRAFAQTLSLAVDIDWHLYHQERHENDEHLLDLCALVNEPNIANEHVATSPNIRGKVFYGLFRVLN